MAIVNTYQPYVNADGLAHKFPPLNATKGKGGEIGGVHHRNMLEIKLSYLDFPAAALDATHVNVLDWNLVIPNGARIEEIEFAVGDAWDSTSSDVTLDFGLVKRSDFTTIHDADGLVAALAKSVIDTENAIVRIHREGAATYAGSALDDDEGIAYDCIVCCNWNNHVPTSGTGTLRIFFRNPGQ